MINVKDLPTHKEPFCYNCKQALNIDRERCYNIQLLTYSKETGDMISKYLISPKESYKASAYFCESCWKSIASEDYMFEFIQ